MANNIRWLGSGPRCGFYEVKLPDLQPGSSIMPGKVNPVMCESLMQVAARVMGNDQTIAVVRRRRRAVPAQHHDAGDGLRRAGKRPPPGRRHRGLRRALPGRAWRPTPRPARRAVEKSLSLVTGLNPYIGYEQAAALAKEAFATGKTIRELCREKNILPEDQLDEALDPWRMTKPS